MIEGKHTYIKAVEEGDLTYLLDWRNNQNFRSNFREHRELNNYQQNQWFEKISNTSNDYMFSIFEKDSNTLIGACGLLYINWIIRSADFSFYIGKDNLYMDEILAPDAVNILLDYGFNFLNLNKVWMELYSFDKQKIDFFKNKYNFKIDATLRENCYEKGEYHDSLIISLLKREYKAFE